MAWRLLKVFLEQSHLDGGGDATNRSSRTAPPLLQNCSAKVMRARMRADERDPLLPFSAFYVIVRSPMYADSRSLVSVHPT